MSDRLTEIRETLEKATPGPWEPMGGFWFEYARVRVHGSHQDIALCEGSNHDANGVFIAHARQDIPFLLSELERVQAERDDLSGRLDAIEHDYYPEIDELNRLRQALEVARNALQLVSYPKRDDGTYNRSREACERLAAETLAEIARLCGKG